MQEIDDQADTQRSDAAPKPLGRNARRRIVYGIAAIVALGLAAILPPLINVNRYQHRIAQSISASLGRPVRIDSVTLNLLPVPGFTLTNFVVSEDPAFGFEPVIRANSVKANLRMRSLWHRRVEFSRITLEDPSVNLVRRDDGKWNFESILLQASRIPVVPTEAKASAAAGVPRFPYIQATGGRVNLKQGLEKKPISLTEADFAVWLPSPPAGQQPTWHVRVEAHPARTDTAASDTGLVRVEGTLGKADRVEDVPVDLHAEWAAAPLGAASWIVMGRDAGARGDMTLRTSIRGTLGNNAVVARLELHRLRRSDFVPVSTLDVDIDCRAQAGNLFGRLDELNCTWQTAGGGLQVTGSLPDTHALVSAQIVGKWHGVPVASLADALRSLSPRDASTVRVEGLLSGEAACCAPLPGRLLGTFQILKPRLALAGGPPLVDALETLEGHFNDDGMTSTPIPLNLGAPEPALLTLSADEQAFHMHLAGTVLRSRLIALARALPQFGDGLEAALPLAATPKVADLPLRVDLTSMRPWANTSAQTWTTAPGAAPVRRTRHR